MKFIYFFLIFSLSFISFIEFSKATDTACTLACVDATTFQQYCQTLIYKKDPCLGVATARRWLGTDACVYWCQAWEL